jgi:hypothetical protein
LLQDIVGVKHHQVVDNLPSFEKGDREPMGLDCFAGRGDAEEQRPVFPAQNPVRDHRVALGDELLNLLAPIGKRIIAACEESFLPILFWPTSGN